MILEIIATTVLVVLLVESFFFMKSVFNIEEILEDIECDLNDLINYFYDDED